jgi:hypothetical protein
LRDRRCSLTFIPLFVDVEVAVLVLACVPGVGRSAAAL